jgi:hypothetical protein
MTFSSYNPYRADIPDPSIKTEVIITVPTSVKNVAIQIVTPSTTPTVPRDLDTVSDANPEIKRLSRIKVVITIENATRDNLAALLTSVKDEVVGKATNLLDLPEAS